MLITKSKNKITIIKFLKKNEMYKLSKGNKSESIYFYRKPQLVVGYSNQCEDSKGILLIDYDGVDPTVVDEDFRYLQEKFKLPLSYVFTTKKNNFHVVCLKKFKNSDVYNILTHTRCDNSYKSMPLRNPYRSWILRISNKRGSKKPKFLRIIGEEKNLDYEISKAHLDLLNKIYKLPKINFKRVDEGKEVYLNYYET